MKKLFEWAITGVFFAIAASILSSAIMAHIEGRRIIKEQLDNISNIYIGCNKEWADERFGAPQFIGQKDEYTLCAYISDYFVIQMAFDEAKSTQAYLITALPTEKNVKLRITDTTLKTTLSDLNGSLTLGEFSYYDFPEEPFDVFGFTGNGNSRMLYAESYYFRGTGNYYEYHIASFDFGKLNGDLVEFGRQFTFQKIGDIDDEVRFQSSGFNRIIADRKNNYPNTFGVSAMDTDVKQLLFSYDWFNSQQLRNKYNYPTSNFN